MEFSSITSGVLGGATPGVGGGATSSPPSDLAPVRTESSQGSQISGRIVFPETSAHTTGLTSYAASSFSSDHLAEAKKAYETIWSVSAHQPNPKILSVEIANKIEELKKKAQSPTSPTAPTTSSNPSSFGSGSGGGGDPTIEYEQTDLLYNIPAFEGWLNKNGLAFTKTSAVNNNCLINALIQHATGNYLSEIFEYTGEVRDRIASGSSKTPLYEDDLPALQAIDLVNQKYGVNLSVCFIQVNEDGNPVITSIVQADENGMQNPVVIWQQSGHYVAITTQQFYTRLQAASAVMKGGVTPFTISQAEAPSIAASSTASESDEQMSLGIATFLGEGFPLEKVVAMYEPYGKDPNKYRVQVHFRPQSDDYNEKDEKRVLNFFMKYLEQGESVFNKFQQLFVEFFCDKFKDVSFDQFTAVNNITSERLFMDSAKRESRYCKDCFDKECVKKILEGDVKKCKNKKRRWLTFNAEQQTSFASSSDDDSSTSSDEVKETASDGAFDGASTDNLLAFEEIDQSTLWQTFYKSLEEGCGTIGFEDYVTGISIRGAVTTKEGGQFDQARPFSARFKEKKEIVRQLIEGSRLCYHCA